MQTIPVVTPRRWLRPIYFAAGLFFVAVGVIGLFLPLIPTTGPLLVSAFFLARSSDRAHSWLTNHPRLGRFISDFESGRGIPFRTKVVAVAAMTAAFGYSTWAITIPWARLLIVAIGIGAITYVLRLPIAPPAET